MVRASALLLVALLSVACAYHNPTAPTPPEDDLGRPTSLTLGTLPGVGGTTVVTAHVQNLHGTPLTNYVVTFATTAGSVTPEVTSSGMDGAASTTLTCTSDARVSVTVGPMHNSTLIAAPNFVGPVPAPPVPFVFLNVQGAALTGDPVVFTVSSSVIGAVWSWGFGDGASESTTAFSTTHRYTRAGTYTATVFGTGTSPASATISVNDKPIITTPTPAAFAVAVTCPKSTTLVQACNVTASATGVTLPSNAITKVSWDFGDGHTDLTTAPVNSRTYASAGTYTVFATVTATVPDGSSQQATTSTTVTVPSP